MRWPTRSVTKSWLSTRSDQPVFNGCGPGLVGQKPHKTALQLRLPLGLYWLGPQLRHKLKNLRFNEWPSLNLKTFAVFQRASTAPAMFHNIGSAKRGRRLNEIP